MKKRLILLLIVIPMLMTSIYIYCKADEKYLKIDYPSSPFTATWNEEGKYLEVIGKNIHLRIYECGKIEKLEWKEINQNEKKFIIPIPNPGITLFDMPTNTQHDLGR